MKQLKTLLISLPWADCHFPSIKVGAVGAYAQDMGFDVKVLHLHLNAALEIGVEEYRNFIDMKGEALSAAILFPQRRKTIINSLRGYPYAMYKRYEMVLRKLYNEILQNDFDLVGFTVDYYQLFSSLLVASWLKRDRPNVRIVFGGLTVSGSVGESILECFSQVDWCISGEGEIPFVELLKELSNGATSFETHVPGLIYRSSKGVMSNPREQLVSLRGISDPDYDKYFEVLKHHTRRVGETFPVYVLIEASRGCTDRCAFCASCLHSKGYRLRPPEEVAHQIFRTSNKYNVLDFNFADLRTPPNCDLSPFIEIIKHGRDYNLFYCIRADISKELLINMKRAGVDEVQIGVEALSSSLLRKMNKRAKFIQNLQVLKYCEELEIEGAVNIILNFPGETQEDVQDAIRNIDFISAYRPPNCITKFALIRGAHVDKTRQKHGISSAQNYWFLDKLIPPTMRRKLNFHVLSFKLETPQPRYTRLRQKISKWEDMYEHLRNKNLKPLVYRDGGGYLIIDDNRKGVSVTKLDGDIRKLYLYCDSIRSFKEIRNRFPEYSISELREVLTGLIELKIMYEEDDDYLSLAIRAHNMQPVSLNIENI